MESVYASNVSQFLYPAPLPFTLMRVPQALVPRGTLFNAKETFYFMNIYVGNLSYNTTEDELRTLFTEFGNVDSAKLIMDRDSGQSKGFGFVEMSDNSGGQQAIEGLNGRDINGRALTVNKAKPREDRPVVVAAIIVAVATDRPPVRIVAGTGRLLPVPRKSNFKSPSSL